MIDGRNKYKLEIGLFLYATPSFITQIPPQYILRRDHTTAITITGTSAMNDELWTTNNEKSIRHFVTLSPKPYPTRSITTLRRPGAPKKSWRRIIICLDFQSWYEYTYPAFTLPTAVKPVIHRYRYSILYSVLFVLSLMRQGGCDMCLLWSII